MTCSGSGFVCEVRFAKKYDTYTKNALEAYYHLNKHRLHADDRGLVDIATKAFVIQQDNSSTTASVISQPSGTKKEKREGLFKGARKAICAKLPFVK